jgi:hypothetical protein
MEKEGEKAPKKGIWARCRHYQEQLTLLLDR